MRKLNKKLADKWSGIFEETKEGSNDDLETALKVAKKLVPLLMSSQRTLAYRPMLNTLLGRDARGRTDYSRSGPMFKILEEAMPGASALTINKDGIYGEGVEAAHKAWIAEKVGTVTHVNLTKEQALELRRDLLG